MLARRIAQAYGHIRMLTNTQTYSHIDTHTHHTKIDPEHVLLQMTAKVAWTHPGAAYLWRQDWTPGDCTGSWGSCPRDWTSRRDWTPGDSTGSSV